MSGHGKLMAAMFSSVSTDKRPEVSCPLPIVLPFAWKKLGDFGEHGGQYRDLSGLGVIVTAAVEEDGRPWLHVSFSRVDRIPSWEDVIAVKELFVGRDRLAVQVFPPRDEHVNLHPYCLHLWCCLEDGFRPTPDFRRGGGI